MPINDLQLTYDDVCVYATTLVKATSSAKFILAFINLLFLGIIVLFLVTQVFVGALFFFGLEIFIIKYTLWNLFGEERLIINTKAISYQQHYGFFTTSFQRIELHKRVVVLPYDQIVDGAKKSTKFLFQSYNDHDLPYVVYHSVLNIPEADFEELLRKIDQMFLDEMTTSYEMPTIYMN